jgi:hypothetical protein
MLVEKFTAIASLRKRDLWRDLLQETRTYAIRHHTDRTSRLLTFLLVNKHDQHQGR